MKTTLIIRGKPDHFNRLPVYVRFSDKQKRTLVRTKLLLTKEQFDRFRTGAPLRSEQDLYKRFLSQLDIKDPIHSVGFFEYVNDCIRQWDKERSQSTITHYLVEMEKLRKFKESFNLADITPDFLLKYRNFCHNLGNSQNTQWKAFKFLKTIIHKALREKLIEENPFDVFDSPKYKDPKKKYLVIEEVQKIEDLLKKKLPEEILFVTRWFLIGCYTGLRFGDMVAFNKKRNIISGRLVVYTGKTGEVVSMPLSEKIRGFLDANEYKPLHYTNQAYNRLLKEVQGLAELDTLLTAHLSRHTFAVMCANKGISQEVTAKLLGHQSLKTTAIYYKITNLRIDEEFQKLG